MRARLKYICDQSAHNSNTGVSKTDATQQQLRAICSQLKTKCVFRLRLCRPALARFWPAGRVSAWRRKLRHIQERWKRSLPIHSAGHRGKGSHTRDLIDPGAPLRNWPAPLLHSGRLAHLESEVCASVGDVNLDPFRDVFGHPPLNAVSGARIRPTG